MQTLLQDTRYAFRQLRRSPGFAITVVLTLALGVGANAIVFSVLNALILRSLPLPQADRLVFFDRMEALNGHRSPSPSQSYPDYRDLRDNNKSFAGVAAYRLQRAGVGNADRMERIWYYEASENYFDVLGVQPALGRFFHPSDAHGVNSCPYVVLSYTYWQRRFNGDGAIIGKSIEVNRHPLTVLGVAPKTFTGTELFAVPDFWTPMLDAPELNGFSSLESRSNHNIWLIGRLLQNVTAAQAESDLNLIAGRLARQYKEDDGLAFRLSHPGLIGDTFGRPVKAFLLGVMGLAFLVLLAACANLGSLFAARASDRAKELAVRLALGAKRVTLLRQLVTESVVISLAGGAAGLLLANGALHALSVWRPSAAFPIAVSVNPDLRVYLLALLLAVASGIFFGLVPARQVWRSNAYLTIKSNSTSLDGRRRWNLRDVLLVVQIVLCSVLVMSSLVAVRGLVRSLHATYGFQPQGVLLASFDLHMAGYTDEQGLAMQKRAIDSVAGLPGVTAVGFTNSVPLGLSAPDSNVYKDGTSDLRESNAIANPNYFIVSPGYLAAAQTSLLAGRDFTWHDDKSAPRVAIVNQTLARMVFGKQNALGRSFIFWGERWQVVGIAVDGKYTALTEDQKPAIFVPAVRPPDNDTTLVIRTRNNDGDFAALVQATLKNIDPNLPVILQTWPDALGVALFPSVAASFALGIMGGLAAMLAVTGIFGMASYSVSKRLRELGLRVALGAQRKQVLVAALGRPARLLLLGSVAGIALGAMASRLLASIVYQAPLQDPVVLLGVVASMAFIALVATVLPARRVLHVDPASLLREE